MTVFVTEVPPPIYVDGPNGRVGINQPSPTQLFEILQANVDTPALRVTRGGNHIDFMSPSGTPSVLRVRAAGTTNNLLLYITTSGEYGVGDVVISGTIFADTSKSSVKIAPFIGGGTLAPVDSAQLEIESTTKGFLPPRMTSTQKTSITSPATGLVIYDTTLNKLCVFTGTNWETVTSV